MRSALRFIAFVAICVWVRWVYIRIVAASQYTGNDVISKDSVEGVAIASLLVGSDMRYLELMCKLGRQLGRLTEGIPLILLVLGERHSDVARKCGWIPLVVEAIEGPRSAKRNRLIDAKAYTKLAVFNLTRYDAVVFLDLDTLPLRPFARSLFTTELQTMRGQGLRVGMARNDFESPAPMGYNSGVILVDLGANSTLSFDGLRRGIDTVPHDPELADQNYLNAVFHGEIYLLPTTYNAMVSMKGNAHDRRFWPEDALILHYTCKPWNVYNCWRDGIEDLCMLWELY